MLVGALLFRLIQVEFAAEIERILEVAGQNVAPRGLEVFHVLLLQGTELGIFDLPRTYNLGEARSAGQHK